jgi:outer membrane protein OmpA-like peptidoglycan-associated protein/opacity protein-like surface antigen
VRSLSAGLYLLLAATSLATAEDGLMAVDGGSPPPAETSAGPAYELGLYSGGFISNYYHQFYDYSLFPGQPGDTMLPVREELKRVSPLVGLRFMYFIKPWLGAEAELNMIATATKYTDKSAKIYGGRLQVVFQAPNLWKYVVPYATIGDGFDRVSSPDSVLGSDTDWSPHVGAGFRFLVHRSITVRLEGRFLRAPSQQPPYHLNASLGEFMFGVSYRPSTGNTVEGPPPPPTTDTDGDGVFDASDKCPAEAEDKDLFDDSDGCPELDNDADGVADADDKCPLEAEDKDGVEDTDGCIDKDNDGDGIADTQDKCPAAPEDMDGFKDADGCPELDNDSDGFADDKDKCPNEAEVINGVTDDDGCADRGDSLVLVSPDRLELLEPISFKKIMLQKSSNNLLGQIGATLRAHPGILRLRITVHVQPTAKPEADLQLSELRAFAIREWLLKYGIDEKRLEPRGFGGEKPLVEPKSKNAAAINDRVELIVLERQ